jgi:leucyl aminopeptidase
MEFNVKTGNPEKQRSACLIVAVSQQRKLSEAGEMLDKASKGFLSTIIRRGDMDGRSGQSLLLHNVPDTLADRVLLIGCGKDTEMNEAAFIKSIGNMSSALEDCGASEAHAYMTDIPVKGRDVAWKVRQIVLQMNHCRYQFEQLKSDKGDKKKVFRKLIINVPGRRDLVAGEAAIAQGIAISAGTSMARDLGNLPSNICTPAYLAKQARQLAKGQKKLKVTVLEEADMRKLKMGSLLSVSAGSRAPAKLITL